MYLKFWATWCTPCRQQMPHFQHVQETAGADRADMLEYRSKYPVRIPLTVDDSGKIFRSFRVNDIPTILIADSKGHLVRRVEAGVMQNGNTVRAALDGL